MRDSASSAAGPDPLQRLIVAFATHRGSTERQRAAMVEQLEPLRGGLEESLLLDTCHRVELIAVRDGEMQLPAGLATARAAAAVARVFEVVAGLDSAVLAEEQLQGQVRTAHDVARTSGTLGPTLDELLRRSLRFGRRVRSHALPGADRSLADRAARWLHEQLPDARGQRALVIGTGEIARLLARLLVESGMNVTVASRRLDRARSAMADVGASQALLQADAIRSLAGTTALAIATRSATPFLDAATLGDARPHVVDLSTPGAVAADARSLLNGRHLAIDALGTLQAAPALLPKVERRLRRELAGEVEAYVAWLESRSSEAGIGILRRHAEAVRQRHVARLRRSGSLDAAQLAAVDATTAGIVAELLHGPTVRLRGDPEAERHVRELFGVTP
ncbi:MAG: NAD(P)-dependent oxidoreductase [Chloroflexota bacterium]